MDSDFMIPLEMEIMEHMELFQIIVIAAMLAVIALKVFGTYLMLRYSDPTIKFNPAFVVSGVLGVFVGYVAYMGSSPVMDATYVDIFMNAGFYALSANLMFDFAGKVKGKLS
jgi:drug/metabolite transporter (DMT)-like permease